MRAAVCREFGSPLRIEEVHLRAPGPGEVLVRIAACAVCHSDIAFLDGAWGGTLPAVYGHEAAGVVVRTGAGAGALAAGDHVVVTLIRSCRTCDRCRAGMPTLCETPPGEPGQDPVLTGAGGEPIHQGMRTGAFAEFVTVDCSQAVVVPRSFPLDAASLLACGVLTGVGAVLNTAAVTPGAAVVVLGTGGVGLNCVQGAALAGAGQIIAADLRADRLTVARAFGATAVSDASAQDTASLVSRLTSGRGADYVFVAAGAAGLVEEGARMLRRGGTLVLVGLPPAGSAVSLSPLAIADNSLRIAGSKMGAARPGKDIPELIRLSLAGRLKLRELISGRYTLDQINDAIAAARDGGQLRPVVVTGDPHGRPGRPERRRQAPP